jgi:hypothetical protein
LAVKSRERVICVAGVAVDIDLVDVARQRAITLLQEATAAGSQDAKGVLQLANSGAFPEPRNRPGP